MCVCVRNGSTVYVVVFIKFSLVYNCFLFVLYIDICNCSIYCNTAKKVTKRFCFVFVIRTPIDNISNIISQILHNSIHIYFDLIYFKFNFLLSCLLFVFVVLFRLALFSAQYYYHFFLLFSFVINTKN